MTPGSDAPRDDVLTSGVPGRRVAAWIVDALILGCILGPLAWFLALMVSVATLGIGWPVFTLLPLVPLAYHAGFLAGGQAATPGMRLLGITARENLELDLPTLGEAVVFTAGLYVTLAAGAVWLLVALVTRHRRALHDIVSGLVIVRTRALTEVGGYGNMDAGAWTA